MNFSIAPHCQANQQTPKLWFNNEPRPFQTHIILNVSIKEIMLLCIKAVMEYVKMIMNTEATLKMEKP